MPETVFYRYLSSAQEIDRIKNERKIRSPNPQGTWYTPTRYNDPVDAQKELALKYMPSHRVGPIPADQMPDFDIPLRPIAPANSQPGGGVEARTKKEVWLFGLYNFITKTYEL